MQRLATPYRCARRLREVRFLRHLCPEKKIVRVVDRPPLAMAIDLEDDDLGCGLSIRLYHNIKAL
jgi:hypothetical protein